MNRKDKIYRVYNPKTEKLDLNEAEHDFIDELFKAPLIKYERITKDYFDCKKDKIEALERIDEILNFYFINAGTNIVTPFTFNPQGLNLAFQILEQLRISLSENQQLAPNSKYTVKQIALSLVYRQMAGSLAEFEEGEKVKKIKEIAIKEGLSWDTLKKAFSAAGSKEKPLQYRLKVLKYKKNQNAISEILKDDLAALNELNIDISKVSDPLP